MTGATGTGGVIVIALCMLGFLPAAADDAVKKGLCAPEAVKEIVEAAFGDQGYKLMPTSRNGFYMMSPEWALDLLSVYAEASRSKEGHRTTEENWRLVAEDRGYGEISYDEAYPIVWMMMRRDNNILDSGRSLHIRTR